MAKETKQHTPDVMEWVALARLDGWEIPAGEVEALAYVPAYGEKNSKDQDVAEANARLIAAAPDLLEAVKSAKDYVGTYSTNPDANALLDILNVAIAKAQEVR